MKIVINKCYGGFSLSPLAVYELAKLKGKKCYFFEGLKHNSSPISLKEAQGLRFFSAYTVKNPYDYFKDGQEWQALSMEDRKKENEKCNAISLDCRPDDRSDPNLIKVVEKLGKKANGICADLKIVKIPDDVEYEIKEYDGLEHVAEKHRIWR